DPSSDGTRLDLIHRFLRLWRRTGWTMWELDLVLRCPAVGNNRLDGGALARARGFQRLQTAFKLDAEELLAFYELLSITNHTDSACSVKTSLYTRLFLDPAVTNPPDPKLAIAEVTGNSVSEKISDHIPSLLAAFMITEQDLSLLLPATDGKLTLPNLSG